MSAGTPANRASAMAGYKERIRTFAHAALDPVVGGLARAGLRPNHLTAFGLVFSLGAAFAFAIGRFRYAALITCFAGVCDILDGQLARRTGGESRFGAFLDSTLDRLAEAAVLVGIAWFYLFNLVDMVVNPQRVITDLQRGLEPVTWAVIAFLAVLALVGSFMVSYTRARAEGLGLDCRVGWFERPERMILVIIMGFFGLGPAIPAGLLVLGAFSFGTALHRMTHVWRLTRSTGPGSDSTEA
ncbi:MAG TPA: CDP-alcohol phosphatidyltransferase family protein [Candidatus Acidoferrales bacterium]|nr:CDP-alcohol phosphatidyltransferase family protein [Candidatus Acidoferrales bacterium]